MSFSHEHPKDRAKTVSDALETLKTYVADGGVVDKEWIDKGGPVIETDSEGNIVKGFYVIHALEVAGLPYGDEIYTEEWYEHFINKQNENLGKEG